MEEVKQRLILNKANMLRYDQRIMGCQNHKLFRVYQKRFYKECPEENWKAENIERQRLWCEIWSKDEGHQIEWLQELKQRVMCPKHEQLFISVSVVKQIT